MKRIIYLLLFLVSSLALPLQAEIYKWTDEHGNVHFGDRPPGQGQAEDISSSLKQLNISTDLSNPRLIQQAEQSRRKANQSGNSDKQDKELNKHQSYCRSLELRLRKIQGRVKFFDDDGNEVRVSEAERKERVKNLKAQFQADCT